MKSLPLVIKPLSPLEEIRQVLEPSVIGEARQFMAKKNGHLYTTRNCSHIFIPRLEDSHWFMALDDDVYIFTRLPKLNGIRLSGANIICLSDMTVRTYHNETKLFKKRQI